MHKSVLIGLDIRAGVAKVSFDASNAHNEFDRSVAMQSVKDDIPELLPWVAASLSIEAVHEYVGEHGKRMQLQKTRGGDQGDALTALLFPLTYKKVAAAVRSAVSEVDANSHTYTYQDDMECVCATAAVTRANDAYGAACAHIGLRANLDKTRLTPGRGVLLSRLPRGLEIDQRAIVLRHGDGAAVPALPAADPADGSQLAEGSIEVQAVANKRKCFYQRLRKLCSAGLRAQSAMDMLRVRTAGDYVFTARACGLPAQEAAALDALLILEVKHLFGVDVGALDPVPDKKIFLRLADGGMGFQSVARTSPAAYTASWHACLPKIFEQYNLSGASALMAVSPWAASCLPSAAVVLREAVGDESLDIGDASVAASQHILAKAPHAAAAKLVSEEVSADIKAGAALRSASGTGAGLWSQAPSLPNQVLSNGQFCVAVRTRLHMTIPFCIGQCQHRRRDGTLCGAPLDPHGYHARICPVGGWVMKRHDAACAVLGAWCEDMGCLLESGQKPWGEVLVPWAAPARPEARMDLVIHVPGVASPYYVDLTVVSAWSSDALASGSAVRDGAAAEVAARGKARDYPNCSVTPFVIEDHGRIGEEALRLLRIVAPVVPSERSKAIRRLHQSLGATLQRIAADAVISATTART